MRLRSVDIGFMLINCQKQIGKTKIRLDLCSRYNNRFVYAKEYEQVEPILRQKFEMRSMEEIEYF